ncbi:MAG: ABC transporter permease subunit [Chloroflexota bacterium]
MAPDTPKPAAAARLRALTAHLLGTQLVSVLIWGVSLGALDVLTVLSYPAFKDSIRQTLSHMSPGARALFGIQGSGTTIESWLALNTFNLIAPLALAFYPIIMGSRAVAGREEQRSMDLLLSNPLPRWVLPAATVLTMAAGLLAVLLLFGFLTWLPAALVGLHLSAGVTSAAVLNLWPLCLCFGALALLCSTLVRRSSLAIAIPGAVVVAMYVAEAIGSTSPSVSFLRYLSLFHYYGSAIEHGIPWASFLTISLLALLLAGVATLAFYRRDIYA